MIVDRDLTKGNKESQLAGTREWSSDTSDSLMIQQKLRC